MSLYCGDPGVYCLSMSVVPRHDGFTGCIKTGKQCVACKWSNRNETYSNDKNIAKCCPGFEQREIN